MLLWSYPIVRAGLVLVLDYFEKKGYLIGLDKLVAIPNATACVYGYRARLSTNCKTGISDTPDPVEVGNISSSCIKQYMEDGERKVHRNELDPINRPARYQNLFVCTLHTFLSV